ncbi:MAG: glucose-6-phosphate isomerase [Ferrovum sp.]|nr:glucose-6-phosphate isomerase [Ferrovum sp.]NDU87042.1 glucose-6-phosphate isomerase [Ferrovum sp.]
MNTLTQSAAWQALLNHRQDFNRTSLRQLFAQDTQRFQRFSLQAGPLFLDYSRNHLMSETLDLLTQLAQQAGLPDMIDAMFSGEPINSTEHRAVLHTALRDPYSAPIRVHGQDVTPLIEAVLERMESFVHQVRSGEWRGFTGLPITDVVNIGIGGSDLGPASVIAALPGDCTGPRVHFVSNVDGAQLTYTLRHLNPAQTLFIIASKTFTTQETLLNAHSARAWFMQTAGDASFVAQHFVALSTNETEVKRFGIDPRHMFEFWDWVGGRYSLWSAIGLSIALGIGMEKFRELLAGASIMDEHFRSAPLAQNMPVVMGLIGVWYINFFGAQTHAILPYDQGLERFVAHIQQVSMESTGKSVTLKGESVDYATGAVVWGGAGTNGQHAYYQLLHQGTTLIPADFIIPLQSRAPLGTHHQLLMANVLAQGEALMRGKTADEARQELLAQGLTEPDITALLPHKVFPGNRPSNTLTMSSLTPYTLGALLALYEHRTFVQGVVWNINTFDQWGVELGKQLARLIEPELASGKLSGTHDASTAGLISRILDSQDPHH